MLRRASLPFHCCVDIRSAISPHSTSGVPPPTGRYTAAHPWHTAAANRSTKIPDASLHRWPATARHIPSRSDLRDSCLTSLNRQIDSTKRDEAGGAKFQDTVKNPGFHGHASEMGSSLEID